MPKKTIIGIHGLANKPEAKTLAGWWKKAIDEGLKKNCGVDDPQYDFHLVYWAKYLYACPTHTRKGYEFDDLYNWEPYKAAPKGALRRGRLTWKERLAERALRWGGDAIDFAKERFGIGKLADLVLEKYLKDLHFYYDKDRKLQGDDGKLHPARQVIQTPLRETLAKHAGPNTLLIAHSMGSIIAYDVLRDIGRQTPRPKVPHFVTIGSPLGLPHVIDQIKKERGYHKKEKGHARVRTPTVVTKSWVNYADRRDPVALDVQLADDFGKNRSRVEVRDVLVRNDFSIRGADGPKPNPHKSYGYLRTPEFSEQIAAFL